MEEMQHLFGSSARNPHESSRLNPLRLYSCQILTRITLTDAPHAKHIDKMLLSNIILLVDIALQRCEDVALLQQDLPTFLLYVQQRRVRIPRFVRRWSITARHSAFALWRNRKIFELLT